MESESHSDSTKLHRPKELVQAESYIGYVLRYGVITCGLVIGFGVVLSFLRPAESQSFSLVLGKVMQGGQVDGNPLPQSISAFAEGLLALNPIAVIAFGLLLLILLPILRVAMTVVLFVMERDLIYLGITLVVLTVLLSSLIFGKSL
jgi:uncharacterized membrane protein